MENGQPRILSLAALEQGAKESFLVIVPLTQPQPDSIVWGADMVRTEDGTCHLFFSYWPKEHGFAAWLTHSRIGYAPLRIPGGLTLTRVLLCRIARVRLGIGCHIIPVSLSTGGSIICITLGLMDEDTNEEATE